MATGSYAAFFRKIKYDPHPKQWLYHNSPARFRVPVCGRRFGKSTMAGRDVEPQLFVPKKRFWIVGPTYDLGEKEFRVIWDDLIIGMGLGRDRRLKKAYSRRTGEMFLEFPWQTRIEVRSAQQPQHLVGEALDGLIMSEAAKHSRDTWERLLRPSLSDKRGWATFPTTPEGLNWLYDLWRYGAKPEFGDYEAWRFPSWDNPKVYPGGEFDDEIKMLRATMTQEEFEQEIAALFTSFVGKIFPEWRDDEHIVTHQFNPAWPNYISFDWGFTNPLAAIEFQVSPWDEIHVWREHYKTNTTLETHLQILKSRYQPKGYRLDMCFGDAADPEAAAYVSEHFMQCLALPEAKENWREGIDLMKRFLAPVQVSEADEYGTPLDKPLLTVDPSCTSFIREVNNYRAPDRVGPTKDRNLPEKGHNKDDHGIDALRYALMTIFVLGATHHLSEVYSPPTLSVVDSETLRTPSHENLLTPSRGSTFFTLEGMNF